MSNIIETFNLIDSFAKLPKRWNFGEGVSAHPISLKQSKELLRFAYDLGHREIVAFPGIGGEIQLCFYNDDDTLEVTLEVNGTATVSVEKGDELVSFREKVFFDEAIKILKDFTYNKCRSYELSTSTTIITLGKIASQVWHSEPRPKMAVSRSSIRIALRKTAHQSANTSNDSIWLSPEHPLYIGKSLMSNCRPRFA